MPERIASPHLTLADGTKAMRDSYCSLSYAPGHQQRPSFKRCANEMGVPVVYGGGRCGRTWNPIRMGYSYIGQADGALTRYAMHWGCLGASKTTF